MRTATAPLALGRAAGFARAGDGVAVSIPVGPASSIPMACG